MLRDDFEREFDNDAETHVKGLVCSRDDDELETGGMCVILFERRKSLWTSKSFPRFPSLGFCLSLIISKSHCFFIHTAYLQGNKHLGLEGCSHLSDHPLHIE